jgi:hypothetical protein
MPTARERRAQAQNQPPKPPLNRPAAVEAQCIHRSLESVGKLKCTCANKPEVFQCALSWVSSGYCIPILPAQPGEGAIVKHDGTRIVPSDNRLSSYIPWPLRDGETPTAGQVVICETCPKREEPAPHIKTLRELGITGQYDPATGHCDVLHVAPQAQQWRQHMLDYLAVTPPELRTCFANTPAPCHLPTFVEATNCRLLVIHTALADAAAIASLTAFRPELRVCLVFHGSQASMSTNQRWVAAQKQALELSCENSHVWFATPEPTAPFTALGYERFAVWPNTIPAPVSTVPRTLHDPPVLLLAGRDDVIKAKATNVLAAGLVNKQRPVNLSLVVAGNVQPLMDMAATASIATTSVPYRDVPEFRQFLSNDTDVLMSATLTDACQYTALDALLQGRPVVGSPALRYLPNDWQADPNDPAAIARAVLGILADYETASRIALQLATDISQRHARHLHDLLYRILAGA